MFPGFLKCMTRELTVSDWRDSCCVSQQCVAASQRCPSGNTKRQRGNMAARLQTLSSWSTVKHSRPNCSMETFNLILQVTEEETIRSLWSRSQPTVISGWNGWIWTCWRICGGIPTRLILKLALVASVCEASGDKSCSLSGYFQIIITVNTSWASGPFWNCNIPYLVQILGF